MVSSEPSGTFCPGASGPRPSGVDGGWPDPWEPLTLPEPLVIPFLKLTSNFAKRIYTSSVLTTHKKSQTNKTKPHRGAWESGRCRAHLFP